MLMMMMEEGEGGVSEHQTHQPALFTRGTMFITPPRIAVFQG